MTPLEVEQAFAILVALSHHTLRLELRLELDINYFIFKERISSPSHVVEFVGSQRRLSFFIRDKTTR